MKVNGFLTYRVFQNKEEVGDYTSILADNNIDYFIEESFVGMVPGFENNDLNKQFRLNIKSDDFEKVNTLILKHQSALIDHFENDYYLFQFTNVELLEIISNKDQWGDFDYLLSCKILKNRGIEITDELLNDFQIKRLKTLSEPKDSEIFWIILAYLSSIIGGFFGIIIGLGLITHKKILPNGEKVWGFSIKDRAHGKRILFIGILMFLIIILFRIKG